MDRTRWFGPTVWGAFFLSGGAGLIYEVVWARYLDLLLGGTAYAHVMVLSAFMGGMALGAWFFGRLVDRLSSPLVLYCYLELAVGVYGLLFTWLFEVGGSVYLGLGGMVGLTGLGGVFNKLFVSMLLIAPSTFLMGGTLPLLVRTVTSLPDRVGHGVAGLYFINSLGAVAGTVLAGFLFIPTLGLEATLATAATINILVGIGVLGAWRYGALTRSIREEGEEETGRRAPRVEAAPPPYDEFSGLEPAGLSRMARIATVSAGISGMVVMIYEVAWIRLLSTILGSSTYSFTLMLAAFITGIAFGSLLARRLSALGRPFLVFALAQLAVGLALLGSLLIYGRLPYIFLSLQSSVSRTMSGYRIYELSKYLFCLALMVPVTLASGVALPLAGDVAARLKRRVGLPIGEVWAVNTLGTILGALIGGLVMLPWLGVRLSLETGIVLNLALGLTLLWLHPRVGWPTLRRFGVVSAVAFLVYLVVAPSWDRQALASGVFRQKALGENGMASFKQQLQGIDVVFYEEDVNGTVAVLLRGENYTMVVNGKADASTFMNDQVTQTMIAAIPALMVPDAREALVIGLGSGQTAGHLLHYPVERVEIVEISAGVVEASRYFDNINGTPLDDIRTELTLQDAKNYLLTHPDRQYDLILSEPSNPWIAGIGGLFTEEYFGALRDRLHPGGVVAQWIHAYEQNDETLTSVLLTFAQVFPHITIWTMSNADMLMVGSNEEIRWDFEHSAAMLARPGVGEDLARIGTRDLYTLLFRQIMSPLRVAEAISLGGILNTNDYPYLEYQAPRAFFMDQLSQIYVRFDERNRTLRNTDLNVVEYLGGREPTPQELANLVHYLDTGGASLPRLPASAAAAWAEADPDNPVAREAALRTGATQELKRVEEAAAIARMRPGELRYQETHIAALIQAYDLLRSAAWDAGVLSDVLLELLPELAERSTVNRTFYHYKLGQVLYDRGRYTEAVEAMRTAVDELGIAADPTRLFQMLQRAPREMWDQLTPDYDPRTPPDQVLTFLGRTLLEAGTVEEARNAFRSAYRLNPKNPIGAFWTVELDEEFTSGRFLAPPP
ncbi:fused MFS/spermidine synthase [Gemmatimonadota bacterium]